MCPSSARKAFKGVGQAYSNASRHPERYTHSEFISHKCPPAGGSDSSLICLVEARFAVRITSAASPCPVSEDQAAHVKVLAARGARGRSHYLWRKPRSGRVRYC